MTISSTTEESSAKRRKSTIGCCRIFYDCEASGQGCSQFRQPRIVELAAVCDWAEGRWNLARTKSGSTTTTSSDGYFSELIAGGPCTAFVSSIHGIDDADLIDARSFPEVWTRFVDFVHKVQGDATEVCLIGHNSTSNDNYWLLSELSRCGRSINELVLPGKKLVFEDIYPLFPHDQKRLKSELGAENLQNSTLYKLLYPHASASDAHTALWDAFATRDIWCASRIIRECSTRFSLDEQLDRWHRCVKKQHKKSISANICIKNAFKCVTE